MWNLTKKITETAQTFNFSDFPLILCGNGPKGTKTTQTQTLFSQIGTFFWGVYRKVVFLMKASLNILNYYLIMKVYFVTLHFISTVKVKIRQISSRMISVSWRQEHLPFFSCSLSLAPFPNVTQVNQWLQGQAYNITEGKEHTCQ